MVHRDDEPSSDRAERQGVTKCDAGSKATAMRRFIIHVMSSVRTVDMPLGRVGLMEWMGGEGTGLFPLAWSGRLWLVFRPLVGFA